MACPKRGKILDELCAKVGIRKRAVAGSSYLTKQELMQIHSWIDIASSQLFEKSEPHGTRGSTSSK